MREVATILVVPNMSSEGLPFRSEGRVVVVTTGGAAVPQTIQFTFNSGEEARILNAARLTERLKKR
jgi:hypothetical protein